MMIRVIRIINIRVSPVIQKACIAISMAGINFIKDGLELSLECIGYCSDFLSLSLHKQAMENKEYNKIFNNCRMAFRF